jgi:hypothetical protein
MCVVRDGITLHLEAARLLEDTGRHILFAFVQILFGVNVPTNLEMCRGGVRRVVEMFASISTLLTSSSRPFHNFPITRSLQIDEKLTNK